MLIFWIVVAICIFLLFFVLKARHFKRRMFAVILVLVLLFVFLTASKVISSNNINLNSPDGFFKAVKVYFVWLWHAGGNIKEITGDAIRMDWLGDAAKNATAK